MSAGEVSLAIAGGIATVTFDRPSARNAMTWAMYEQLGAACTAIEDDPSIRVATLRGAGGYFVSGTDISQFAAFEGSQAGLDYETRINACVATVESLRVPTIAVVEGGAMGGGFVLAAACDFRIVSSDSQFAAPIAMTVGNCLSMANVARLVAAFGAPRTKRLLILADVIGADEAVASGFALEAVSPEELEGRVAALCVRLISHAPITMRVSKEAIRRLVANGPPPGDDLIAAAYGSRDFKEGVAAFMGKRKPRWEGR